jgi:sensor histidine kinase YesM
MHSCHVMTQLPPIWLAFTAHCASLAIFRNNSGFLAATTKVSSAWQLKVPKKILVYRASPAESCLAVAFWVFFLFCIVIIYMLFVPNLFGYTMSSIRSVFIPFLVFSL